MIDAIAAPKPTYARTVITTKHKAEPAAPAELKLTADDVKMLSKRKKDPAWLARKRLTAWKLYQSMPMPTLNDEVWRRTDLRPFKWTQTELSALNGNGKARPVPAAFLKPLAGKEQGGQLVVNAGKVEASKLSATLRRKGVIFTDFQTAAVKHDKLLTHEIKKCLVIQRGGGNINGAGVHVLELAAALAAINHLKCGLDDPTINAGHHAVTLSCRNEGHGRDQNIVSSLHA